MKVSRQELHHILTQEKKKVLETKLWRITSPLSMLAWNEVKMHILNYVKEWNKKPMFPENEFRVELVQCKFTLLSLNPKG